MSYGSDRASAIQRAMRRPNMTGQQQMRVPEPPKPLPTQAAQPAQDNFAARQGQMPTPRQLPAQAAQPAQDNRVPLMPPEPSQRVSLNGMNGVNLERMRFPEPGSMMGRGAAPNPIRLRA